MRGRLAWIAAAVVIGSSTLATSAHAQNLENEHDGYIAAKLILGFGGEAELDPEGDLGALMGEDDLETSYGLGVAYMQPLHEYFALGGQLAFQSWTTDGLEDLDFDRSVLMDLSLVPQAKYAVRENVELYASLPLGITFDFFGEDDYFGAEVKGGFGFNLGLFLGARVALDDSFGLLGELGYSYHVFEHTLEIPISGTELDFDISMGQLGLNLGGFFQL